MAKICFISHGHPAANPRLVREANVLHGAGHQVRVVTPRFVPQWVQFDDELLKNARWTYHCADFLTANRLPWIYVRARRRFGAALARRWPTHTFLGWACNYANPELARIAAEEGADLYIAHQHHSLPAAASAAAQWGSRFGFDAEDLLADSSAEPTTLIRQIERRYLPHCAYISTMSHAAARRLRETNALMREVTVLHNTARIEDRASIAPPDRRPINDHMSIYWFGQTIGPHSRADQVLRALPLLPKTVRLVLRGAPQAGYVRDIEDLATKLGVRALLDIAPLAAPDRMVPLAAEHDVLLGTQPGHELFNQMAIGNKVFTGMMAGLALALTDTIAHRELLAHAQGSGFLFADADERSLARELGRLLADPARLRDMKRSSWDWAAREFNWEMESRRHVSMIEALVSGAKR